VEAFGYQVTQNRCRSRGIVHECGSKRNHARRALCGIGKACPRSFLTRTMGTKQRP